jgi:hypothetical protein
VTEIVLGMGRDTRKEREKEPARTSMENRADKKAKKANKRF